MRENVSKMVDSSILRQNTFNLGIYVSFLGALVIAGVRNSDSLVDKCMNLRTTTI